ncbi:MAG: SpoIID/LytB domain-containing protein [Candidatus Korobacteraceae bacterium]
MKRFAVLVLLLTWALGAASPSQTARTNKNIGAPSSGFPHTVRVRLWYLHPPSSLTFRAEAEQASVRKCANCAATQLQSLSVSASGTQLKINNQKSASRELRMSGIFQMIPQNGPPVRADFPVEISASAGRLQITATMPMDEYIAGVLAGETGNFKSDEALKAMAVAARTYALHFGSRHAMEGFDYCDTTHCQDLLVAGITDRLRNIVRSTAGEVLWYDGKPAATYYHANCGGTTEDGRYMLANDEAAAPYLVQHSDTYCVRNGSTQWHSEVTKRELQRALNDDGIIISGTLRSLSIVQRTPSGRVETLRVVGASAITVPGVAFRSAVGRHVGWDRLKSNWYDVSVSGDRVSFTGRGLGHGVGLCQIGAEVMGEEGKSYREILAYYYPGTKLGVAAQGIAWQKLTGENIELLTTRPAQDQALVSMAARLVRDAEASTGLTFASIPQWKVYPTVAMFRDATGEPGWVAATTRGHTIQSQPADVLKQAGTLESTLRHELLHMLIEAHAKPGTPVWYREGLVLYLSEPNTAAQAKTTFASVAELEKAMESPASEEQLRKAYAEAHARVSQLAQRYGKQKLLVWVQQGLPSDVVR